MPKNPSIKTDPALYEVLGAPFFPDSDPSGDWHTLGRLAYAGIRWGEHLDTPHITTPEGGMYKDGYRLTPKWAPRAIATTLASTDILSNVTLQGIHLADAEASENTLMVYRLPQGHHAHPRVQLIYTGSGEPFQLATSPEALPAEFLEAQLAIAGAAKQFFDSLIR